MVFSSTIFLWVFLPLVLVLYFIADKKYKNYILLTSSIIFYTWGEPKYIVWMLLSILLNYIFGLLMDYISNEKMRTLALSVAILCNLGLLGYFKYFNFVLDIINNVVGKEAFTAKEIALPIGISFYTFQALSYVVDVYRSKRVNGELKAQKNILNVALYVSFFPQLIAGPIVKYYDIENQIYNREENTKRAAYGIKRFVLGLSKKILISNTMAAVADDIFALNIYDIGTPVAWIGIIAYTLQIYYDFSGYSDMAIGLGEIFGFTFRENFNYPYISGSIKEFWNRWHISLSSWFKEYLYIPLGGNRKGKSRTYLNLIIVFFCTGLWHGASFNFVFWGLFHGFFMVIERLFLGKLLKKNKIKFINTIYTMLVVIIGWVFFRVEEFSDALTYLKIMFTNVEGNTLFNLGMYLDKEIIFVIVIGILFAGIIQSLIPRFKNILYDKENIKLYQIIILMGLLYLCIVSVVSGAYNPFIYFRF